MTEPLTSSSVPVRASGEPQISAIKSLLSELADGRPLCDPTMDDPPCASCEAIFQKFYELAAAASPSDDGARQPQEHSLGEVREVLAEMRAFVRASYGHACQDILDNTARKLGAAVLRAEKRLRASTASIGVTTTAPDAVSNRVVPNGGDSGQTAAASDDGAAREPGLDLEPIKAREAKATRDHLRLMRYEHGGGRLAQFSPRPKRGPLDDGEDRQLVADFYEEHDREFYYHARTDIPALLTEIERQRARIVVLETSVDSLRYLIDHPVTQEQK